MSTNKTLEKIKDAVEEAIRPIIAKGAGMNAAELDVLTKAVCTIEKIEQIESGGNNYDDTFTKNEMYGEVNCLIIRLSQIEGENTTREDKRADFMMAKHHVTATVTVVTPLKIV